MFQSPLHLNKTPSSSSSSWSSWSSHPSMDYSFKHSFAWPHGVSGPAPTGTAAGAAEAASHAHGHGMQYHYHGRGGYPFYPHRHRGGRRFIWFGLGVALTAWYFEHQEHKREALRMVQATTTGSGGMAVGGANEGRSGHFWRDGCDNSWGQGWKRTAAEYTGSNGQHGTNGQHGQQGANFNAPVPALPSDHTDSAVLAALDTAHPPASAQNTSPVKDEENKQEPTVNRGWGWGRRRHAHADPSLGQTISGQSPDHTSIAIDSRSPSSPSSSMGSNTPSSTSETELKRLREVVEALWRDDQPLAPLTTKKDQADEQARQREQAREKLERLSTALNALRESLKTDRELDRGESKKLV